MTQFLLIFVACLVLNVAVTFRSSDYYKKRFQAEQPASPTSEETHARKDWEALIRRYLPVYLLATMSDWLQGPYVYALYAEYGYTQHQIAELFVAGFGSSMIFGSFVGGMADWGGRRAFVILFAAVYGASCITKHFKSYPILMIGRLLGGIATSLLFSVFDAWLIRAHSDAKLKQYLGRSFSWASYGNSIVAILAGLVANNVAGIVKIFPIQPNFIYAGGFLNPFDVALCALMVGSFLAATTWEENYGDATVSPEGKIESAKWYNGLRTAFLTTVRSHDILLCGIISSLYEGSMYIFVFMWTPALTRDEDLQLPFGMIFSCFMVMCMAGSSLFSIQIEHVKGEKLAVGVFAVASFAMFCIALSSSNTIKFLCMNLFEMTVGMYWPIMGTMKGSIVPESKRAAIYNLYRIPLNFIVLFSLLTDLTPTVAFGLNGLMLATATGLQMILMKRRELTGLTTNTDESTKSTGGSDDETPLLSLASSPEKLSSKDEEA